MKTRRITENIIKIEDTYDELLQRIIKTSNEITRATFDGEMELVDLYRILLNMDIDNAVKMKKEENDNK